MSEQAARICERLAEPWEAAYERHAKSGNVTHAQLAEARALVLRGAAREIRKELSAAGDPFPDSPPSTDPARDQANHRELCRQARRMMGRR